MSEPFSSTVTETVGFDVDAVYSLNDGHSGARPVNMQIDVTSARRSTIIAVQNPLRREAVSDWIRLYLDNRDLRYQLSFEPTPQNLAVYLADVFRAVDPEVRAVAVSEGNVTATVIFDE